MTDVAAAATAIATAITASITPSTGAPTVQLTPFSGSPTEDFRVFKEQIQSSIALAQVPDVGKVDYLKLDLTGGALSNFLELPPGDKNSLDNALAALERRYFSANQLELYKLKFQEKFDESKETPENYLKDLTKLANIAFANATGTDRSGERTRRIRDAFISGMPTQIRLKLLMRPDTDTVATLCSQVSKCLVLKSILPDDESSTAFNVVDNAETDTLTKVLNSVVEAQRDISKTQKQIGQQMSRMDKSMQFNSRSNYPRTRIRDRGQGRYSQHWTQRNPNWNYGVIFKTKHTASKITIGHHAEASTTRELSDRGYQQSFVESADNQAICRETAWHDSQHNKEVIFHSQPFQIKKTNYPSAA